MRTKLIGILRQTAVQAERFNDYNFRIYFVNKYKTQAEKIEGNVAFSVNTADIAQAQMYVE